jgi:hypothetical protein
LLTVIERLGNVLYWTASGIAVLLAVLGASGFVIALVNKASDGMVLAPLAIALAILIWLAGRACLYILAGR